MIIIVKSFPSRFLRVQERTFACADSYALMLVLVFLSMSLQIVVPTDGLATRGLATGSLATRGLATRGLATGGLATGGLAAGSSSVLHYLAV